MTDEEKELARAEALEAYTQAYREYNSISITQEESSIKFNQAARDALNLGIPLQDLRNARRQIDNHAQFMTDWK